MSQPEMSDSEVTNQRIRTRQRIDDILDHIRTTNTKDEVEFAVTLLAADTISQGLHDVAQAIRHSFKQD